MFLKKVIDYIDDRILFSIKEFHRKQYEKLYFKKLRKRLKITEFSLFSPNCYAGKLYHRLGLQFQSPTINLLFPIKKQYLKFLSNLEYYLSKDLHFIDDPEYDVPVAMLEDIKLVFVHYRTQEEAEISWNKRKTRVNYDKLLFIFDDICDIEYSDILEFCNLKCAGKVILTAKKYDDIPCAVQIKKYSKTGELKPYLMDVNSWTGKNAADKYFDFVSWINNCV